MVPKAMFKRTKKIKGEKMSEKEKREVMEGEGNGVTGEKNMRQ